jgi:hypothetical protein
LILFTISLETCTVTLGYVTIWRLSFWDIFLHPPILYKISELQCTINWNKHAGHISHKEQTKNTKTKKFIMRIIVNQQTKRQTNISNVWFLTLIYWRPILSLSQSSFSSDPCFCSTILRLYSTILRLYSTNPHLYSTSLHFCSTRISSLSSNSHNSHLISISD